jgi:hypothetical protein
MIEVKKILVMLLVGFSVFFMGCGDSVEIDNTGEIKNNSVQTEQENNQETQPDEVVDSIINEEEALIDEEIELGELI